MESDMVYGNEYKSSWKALPIDGGAGTWDTEFGVAQHSISRTIEALDVFTEARGDSLYQKIMVSQGKKKQKEDGRDTHPAPLYWETKPLIQSLVYARKNSPGKGNAEKSGDKLADKALWQLASELSAEEFSGKRYAQIQFISNSKIRERMVNLFRHEIDIRLAAVTWFTSNKLSVDENSSGYMETEVIKNILTVCQAMDVLIDRLGYSSCTNDPLVSPVTVQDIDAIYEDLVAERKRITTYNGPGEDIITTPSLPNTSKNQKIIRRLNAALSVPSCASKNKQLTQKEQSRLENSFENYLLATISADKKKNVEEFVKNFSTAQKFFQHGHPYEDFESGVRDTLIEYVKEVFQEVNGGNLILYLYDSYHPQSVEDMFLGEEIKNAQQHIICKLGSALESLYRANVLAYYFVNETELNRENLSKLASQIHNQIQILSENYESLPLGPVKNFPVEDFINHYNQSVAPQLGFPMLDSKEENRRYEILLRANLPVEIQLSAKLLLHICELVSVHEIELTLVETKRNYEALRSFYTEWKF